jgi:hypothetical protein
MGHPHPVRRLLDMLMRSTVVVHDISGLLEDNICAQQPRFNTVCPLFKIYMVSISTDLMPVMVFLGR